MKALSTSLIKRWKKLLETGERTEKGGEKSKERNGEKERKVEKEKKGKEGKKVKVDAKEAARDSAREQTKDSYTGDEVRDRWLSKKRREKIHLESCYQVQRPSAHCYLGGGDAC